MTDAAEVMDVAHFKWACTAPAGVQPGAAMGTALMSLAPDAYPRRVVLEQESEGGPVVVRLLDGWQVSPTSEFWTWRLIDPEEAP